MHKISSALFTASFVALISGPALGGNGTELVDDKSPATAAPKLKISPEMEDQLRNLFGGPTTANTALEFMKSSLNPSLSNNDQFIIVSAFVGLAPHEKHKNSLDCFIRTLRDLCIPEMTAAHQVLAINLLSSYDTKKERSIITAPIHRSFAHFGFGESEKLGKGALAAAFITAPTAPNAAIWESYEQSFANFDKGDRLLIKQELSKRSSARAAAAFINELIAFRLENSNRNVADMIADIKNIEENLRPAILVHHASGTAAPANSAASSAPYASENESPYNEEEPSRQPSAAPIDPPSSGDEFEQISSPEAPGSPTPKASGAAMGSDASPTFPLPSEKPDDMESGASAAPGSQGAGTEGYIGGVLNPLNWF